MVGEHYISRAGSKRYLVIKCKECANNSSLGNRECFTRVVKKFGEEKDIDGIVFDREYRKIVRDESVKKLKEYLKIVNEIKWEHELCGNCNTKALTLKLKLNEDPVGAVLYFDEIAPCDEDKKFFESIRKDISKSLIYKEVIDNRKKFNENEIYHVLFRSESYPSFAKFYMKGGEGKVIESYLSAGARIEIRQVEGKRGCIYHIEAEDLKLNREELEIVEKGFEALRDNFNLDNPEKRCEEAVERAVPNLNLDIKKKLGSVLRRYSFGYGILEAIFNDPKIQDIYIDSPGDREVYVYHRDYEECPTNIVLTNEEIEKLNTKFRLLSGRPFDEGSPTIDLELKEVGIRVAGIMEPMTYGGTGFAFRKHAVEPWTLSNFVKERMINCEAAALLSFLAEGQKSILVTGPRGSGKTSLMGSLIAEIDRKHRIIVIEDTPELPVDKMKGVGFNMQHIRVRSPLQKESYEASAVDALRSALRLGESVLVIGEVRGEEARSLFEAMRIGAAGNVVLGTVHGSSAYDVWDRVVNDLNVPSTSFKATDIIIECAPVKSFEDIKKKRRVVGIVEVGKGWNKEPGREGGFIRLMEYDWKKDKLFFTKEFAKSELIKEVAKHMGLTVALALKVIESKRKMMVNIIDFSERYPHVLNMEFMVRAAEEQGRLLRERGCDEAVKEFKKWLENE